MFGSRPTREYKIPVRVATSPTVRANGPAQSRAGDSGTIPSQEMRPHVGFRPTMPHSAAGKRMQAPVAVAILPEQNPGADGAGETPLRTPRIRSRAQGVPSR